MVSAFDVAKYILLKTGSVSAMKLQKLVYYSQAWSLVWDDEPLFRESIQAWANGPVVRSLYAAHRKMYLITQQDLLAGSADELSDTQKATVDAVIKAYGDKSAQWLSDQTHSEDPWKIARSGLAENERGENEITLESMSEYYSSLQ